MKNITISKNLIPVRTTIEGTTPYTEKGQYAGKKTVESFTFEEHEYKRTIKHSHYSLDCHLFFIGDESDKGIICECGCYSFILSYESYAINATCSNCGIQEEVYSG